MDIEKVVCYELLEQADKIEMIKFKIFLPENHQKWSEAFESFKKGAVKFKTDLQKVED